MTKQIIVRQLFYFIFCISKDTGIDIDIYKKNTQNLQMKQKSA